MSMKLNIGSVLKNEGSVLNISEAVDVGRLSYLGSVFDFKEPLKLEGRIKSIGGALELTGSISGEYVTSCCSCGTPVAGRIEAAFDEDIDSGAEDFDPECFALSGSTLDISGLINALIWENLPMRPLCREDCMGLCSICGCNLNETVCNCDHTVYDPRLAILRERS